MYFQISVERESFAATMAHSNTVGKFVPRIFYLQREGVFFRTAEGTK
jgi:hypothetical protein